MPVSRDDQRPIDRQLVEYVVIDVPDEQAVEMVLEAVEQLASRGLVCVLDGAIVGRSGSGVLSVAELPRSSDRRPFLGRRLGVLSANDLELIADALPLGTLGLVVVVEDEWAKPLADAARSVGGHVAGGERIPPARLGAVLPGLRFTRGALS